MTWVQLRERLIYVAMSAFVAWHTIAIIVGPAPESALAGAIRNVLHPYLTLFRLNNKWDFYAPNVGRGQQLHYVVEGAAASSRTYVPVDELKWRHPGYWWFRAYYDAIIASPDLYADAAALALCRKHAALKPEAITFLKVEEQSFVPEDHLNGRRPLDPEFIAVSTLKKIQCPVL